MTTGNETIQGYAPAVKIAGGNAEALKYGRLWGEHPEYRQVSPGEQLAHLFLAQARPKKGASAIDFGCGTGRGALSLALFGGLNVTMVDFVRNCLDEDVRAMLTTQAHALRFVKADLEQSLPVAAEYGFCCDVMEHIPPDKVNATLNNILRAAQHCFFSIATTPDACGTLIGEELHLTVRPYAWWLEQFNVRGAVIHWSQEVDGAALFYVTAWATGEDITAAGILNISEEQLRRNVTANAAGGWQQIVPHATNDLDVMILGGGPSMPAFLEEIKAKRAEGVKLVTLNGAYNWALANGLTPSATTIVDARPFNARFVRPVVEDCRYLIASICDPSVFEGLPKDRTFLYHAMVDVIHEQLNAGWPEGWYGVPGGSTVLLRAIPMLRMLGYRRFHLYGCDSCLSPDGAHHAYGQPENDGGIVAPVILGGRTFACAPWMTSQCSEFLDMIKMLGDEIELEIHGDGLLSWALEYAAQQAADEESTWPTSH